MFCVNDSDSCPSEINLPDEQIASMHSKTEASVSSTLVNSNACQVLQSTNQVVSSRPTFLELCCGSAGLTAAANKAGYRGLGIDWIRNKAKSTKAHILNLDLTEPSNQKFVLDMINSKKVQAVHMGPPCGTASRARDKPLNRDAVQAGVRRPLPLRSSEFPLGLPNLAGTARVRVDLANKLYLFCSQVATSCSSKEIPWAIENPQSSYFWDIPVIKGE